MRILDRYVARQLIQPLIFCCLTLIFLVFIADLFDNLDDMLRHKTQFFYIIQYYLLTIPDAFVQTISWASLLSMIYLLTSLNYHNEITAMKVAGLEITSIIRPILFIGLMIGIATFIVNDRVVPVTNYHAKEILEKRIEKNRETGEREIYKNVTYFGGGDRLYYAQSYDPELKQLNDFIILWVDADKKVRKKTVAQRAIWAGDHWDLHDATDYIVEHTNEMVGEPTFKKLAVYPEIQETPEEFLQASKELNSISYHDLRDFIQKMKHNGIKLSSENVELQYRLAYPWQSLIVMFMTIPFLAKTVTRRMIAMNILACLGAIFAYHITGALMLALGKAGKMFPVVSAWFHNVVFGVGVFFFLDRANE